MAFSILKPNRVHELLHLLQLLHYYIYMDKDTGKDNDLDVDMNLCMDMDNTDT